MITNKERKRINSISAGLRKRQRAATKALRRNKIGEPPQRDITDSTVKDFIKEAKENGLDLATIAALVAAEKTE